MSQSGSNLASGFIDLATYDEQEKYLYGGANAVTYFVKAVRKATWFTIVPVVLSRTGNSQFGSQFSATISRAGDYMVRCWLRVQIPAISVNFTANNVPVPGWNPADLSIRWTRNLMHNLIQEASITFNDLVEARFDSYFLDFWSAFTIPAGKRNGYQNMIGNFEELTNPLAISNAVTARYNLPSAVLNLPLPFSHFRETGVALPAAALPYNEMKINFMFRDWYRLLIIDNTNTGVSTGWPANLLPSNNSQPQLTADVWAEYALVSNMERVQMGKAPRDMLIEQVQTAPLQIFNAQSSNGANNIVSLYFAHAIKSLFFGIQNTTNNSEWSNYTCASPVPTANGVIFSPRFATDPVASTSLFYENTQRLSNMGSDYYSLIQPWYCAVSIPLETGYHMYSYTLDLLNTNPMGSSNYGKLTNVSLSFTPSSDAVLASSSVGTLANPSVQVTPDNYSYVAGGVGVPQTFQSVVEALNHNIIRIAGGALGFPVL